MMSGLIILGLTGRAGAGKDTAARYLSEQYGLACFAFADPIKHLVERLHPEWPRERIWGRSKDVADARGLSSRALCQELGGALRGVHPDYWLWQAERQLQQWREEELSTTFAPIRGVLWTDVRYPNEAQWIHDQGGQVVCIVRRDAGPVRDHESEAGIGEERIDSILANNGSLELLHARLDGLMLALFEDEPPGLPKGGRPGRYPWGGDEYE